MKFKFIKNKEIIYNISNIKYVDRNNKLTFMVEKTKCIFELLDNGCIFIRDDKDYKFRLDTIKRECTLELKEMNKVFDIKINDLEYKNIDNKIILKYNIETDDALNVIEIIRGE